MTQNPCRTLSHRCSTTRSSTSRRKRRSERVQMVAPRLVTYRDSGGQEYPYQYQSSRRKSTAAVHNSRRCVPPSAMLSASALLTGRRAARHRLAIPASSITPLRSSMHAICRWGERVHRVDLESVRRGLAVVERGTANHQAAESTAHESTDTPPERVPDAALLAFLMTCRLAEVHTWASEVAAKLSKVERLPFRNFDVVDRNLKVRLVIRERVLVTVTPLSKTRRRS